VKASDVAGSDTQSISALLQVLSHTGEHNEIAEQQTELYHAIDEYFRGKFRKLSGKDAVQIVSAFGERPEQRLLVLDQKFWIWETLDEALRPVISDLPKEDILTLSGAFAQNFKGSEDLWHELERRIYLHGRPSPF
jgi:hypothetical protein